MQKIKNWLWIDKSITDSTNDDAIAFSKELRQQKFIISAQKQTLGRGRRGRKWIGCEGNLFFSQGLEFPLQRIGELVCLSSLSLYQTISELLPDSNIKIKWPNDILINAEKVSGTLLEKGDGEYLVIGIGVNLNHIPDIANSNYNITSLLAHGISVDRLSFLHSYINKFDNNYEQLETQGFPVIRELWLSAVYGLEKEISVVTENNSIKGIFKGIGNEGELLLEVDNIIKKIYTGDVFYIKKED